MKARTYKYNKTEGIKYGKANYKPMGDIIAAAAGCNVNTIYTLARYLNEYIEVRRICGSNE